MRENRKTSHERKMEKLKNSIIRIESIFVLCISLPYYAPITVKPNGGGEVGHWVGIKVPTPGQKIIVKSIKIPHPGAREGSHIPFTPCCTEEESNK